MTVPRATRLTVQRVQPMLTHSGQAWGGGSTSPWVSHSLARVQSWKSDWFQTRSSWAKEGVQLLQEEVVRERERESTLEPLGRREFRAGWASPVLRLYILNLASTPCRHSLLSIPTMLYLLPSGPFTGLLTALLARLLHKWLWF